MASLSQELLFLINQFLKEEGLKKTAHQLEQETGIFFDLDFFEGMLLDGKWDEAEVYLSGFSKVDDNRFSTKIYFEVRKQKFLESLDNKEHDKALDMLRKELKVFAAENEELYKEMTLLLTEDDIRNHKALGNYGDTNSARAMMTTELSKLIKANPLIHGKLQFPKVREQRLRRLINQSLNWQHIHCMYPQSNPRIKTLFEDHACELPRIPLLQLAENDQAVRSPCTDPGLSRSSISVPDDLPANPISNNLCTIPERRRDEELPTNVAGILDVGSFTRSMDFHPIWQTLLLVGTVIGDIVLWEVNSGDKLFSRNFKVWDVQACSMMFKTALVKDPSVYVNRVIWSPAGSLFAVAFSKHIVQLYSYDGGNRVEQRWEFDAHVGGVNDLAFSALDEKLLVISCGDDKTIKVWDVASHSRMYLFEGHEAPVLSLCPHVKEDVHFLFSASLNGKIKVWLFDDLGVRVDYDAPGRGPTRLAYSDDDKRLFSCSVSGDGESFLVEYEDSDGMITRRYQGLSEISLVVKQFDTTKNRFLAVGDNHSVKIWDMDDEELLRSIDAGGGLIVNPSVRFNKEGTLLAVTAKENRIKILATDNYLQLLRKSEHHSGDASAVLSDSLNKRNSTATSSDVAGGGDGGCGPVNGGPDKSGDEISGFTGEATAKLNIEKLFQIERPSQCQSLQLSADANSNKISRLIYTNAGNAILALESNGIHLLWKWTQDDRNLSGKATTKVPPVFWRPRNCLQLMTNEIRGVNLEKAVHCFVLSKNDSYLISASGGKISLFNMLTFKTITTFMPPLPAATCLAFDSQDNNIIAIGMNDGKILIYNVRISKVKSKLEGHSERVTGLAFSGALNVLVSSGADSQIFVWNADNWEKKNNKFLQSRIGNISGALYDTQIQFNQDQTQFLVVQDSHLAIYKAKELECVRQWVSPFSALISQATYSCDSQMVYASFNDGTISIFNASNLELDCRITSSAYLPSSTSLDVYPLCIAAHPQIPTQFAVGLTDGVVCVLEPRYGGSWGNVPSEEDTPECSKTQESIVDDAWELIKPRIEVEEQEETTSPA